MKYRFTLLLLLLSYGAYSQCNLASTLTATPAQPPGGYLPGTTVVFCYDVTNWQTAGANWIHGISPSLGPGWIPTSLGPATGQPNGGAPLTCGAGAGVWSWYNTNITGVSGGGCATTNGPGFYFETSTGGPPVDGNPGNNWGNSCGSGNIPITACFQATVDTCSGAPTVNLNITVNTTADSETGSWGSCGCENDVNPVFNYTGLCCVAPTIVDTDITCFGDNNGSFSITGNGPDSPWTYQWSGPSSGNLTGQTGTHSETNQLPGTYLVTVTDATNCSITSSFQIVEPPVLGLSISVGSDVSCSGAMDGELGSTPTGGVTPYTYNWNNAPNVQNPSNLNGGIYILTVTDANMCTVTGSASIFEPPPLSASSTGETLLCFGDMNGDINLTFNGGVLPYTYNWTSGHTVEDPSNLGGGIYFVTISDANNCAATSSAEIIEPPQLTGSAIGDATLCFGQSTGDIDLTVGGGTVPYTYAWNNGSTIQDPNGLPAGNYTVTVTDASMCTITVTTTVTQPAQLTAQPIPSVLNCFGDTNGTITLNVNGGTTPYTYIWNNAVTTQNQSGLGSGPYNVTVTDANGCIRTATTFIFQPGSLNIGTTVNNHVSCGGGSNGSATAGASGGTTPYTFFWDTGTTGATATNLNAGSHTVTVSDGNNCTNTATVNITQPTPINASATGESISCAGSLDGDINLTVSGGSMPYTFIWSNGATTEDLSGLDVGTYTVTVTDSNTCTGTASASITAPPGSLMVSAAGSTLDCFGDTDGTLSLTVTGGTTPYTFDWDNAPDVQNPTGLGGGIYNVTVSDANMCSVTASAEIVEPPALSLSVTLNQNVTCSGSLNGSATVSPSGGSMPYTFAWDNGETNSTATGLNGGTHVVTVTDAGACANTASVVITEPALLTASATGSAVACNGNTNGSINLTVGGGTVPYTYAWNNGAGTNEDPTGLGAGTYTVTVTDANLCTVTASAQITQPTALSASATGEALSCNGNTDGDIDLTVSGGTTPYTYNWNNGAGTNQDPSGLGAGTYTVTVTDANLCTVTASAAITQPAGMTASATGEALACNGDTNGDIDLTVSGGTIPYTYNWNNGAGTNQDPSGLGVGTYTVSVSDNNGCTVTASASITQPTALTASATGEVLACNGTNDGDIDLTVNGGTIPYTYAWNNGAGTNQDPSGLGVGNYTVTVTDANLCTVTASAAITQPSSLAASATGEALLCNGNTDGDIDLTVTGGSTPYTYAWNNGAGTNQDPSGLGAGSYTVTVTDANMCSVTATANITQPAILTASATGEALACNGDTNGDINLTVNGGTTPYTFSWNNGAGTNEDPSGLGAGTYTVTVTDANMCSVTASTQITQPTLLTASASATNLQCFGDTNGSIDLTVGGGTMPYTYAWNNGAGTNQDPSGLGAGTYTVTVTDAGLCTVTASAQITQPPLFSASATGEALLCNGNTDGDIDLTVTGGSMPYTYAWNNGAGTNQDPTGLGAGTYSVTVTDGNNCTATASAQITQPTLLTTTITGDALACNGDTDGNIDLNVNGGTPPYTYLWNNGAGTNQDPSGLGGGTYSVTITDNNGCFTTNQASVTEPTLLTASATGEALACNGDANGDIDLTVNGGTLPYTYSWNNGAGTNQDPAGLGVGIYTVIVTDANLCSVTASAEITQPSSLTASATGEMLACNGFANGDIDLTVNGGTPPYTYSWNNGAGTNQDPAGLIAGTYSVTVLDANNCSAFASASITQPPALIASAIGEALLCNGNTDGNIDLTVSGGTLPYTYTWDNGAGTNQDPFGLGAGTYSVTVIDANGCGAFANATITQPTALLASATGEALLCNGDTDGNINLTVSGGTPPYTYNWNNGAGTNQDPSGLGAGTFTVTVSDGNGCIQTASASITQPALLTASAIGETLACNGDTDGNIDLTVAGGTLPYTFIWNNGAGSNEDPSGLTAGTYTVTVIDNNLCTAITSATISQPSVLTTTVTLINHVSCNSANDGSASASGAGGTLPYTFSWDNGETTSTSTGLNGGLHTVTVTDANMCTVTGSININEPAAIAASATGEALNCNGDADGNIDLTVTGGTMPFTYVWDNGAGTNQDPAGLGSGIYTVTVTDVNLCSISASAEITEPATLLTLLMGATTPANCTSCDGTADLSVSGGVAPYTFLWSNGNTNEDPDDLCSGNNNVTVTDNAGCVRTATASVGNTSTLIIDNTTIDNQVSCNGQSDGQATATVSGGQVPYTFNWSNGSTTSVASNLPAGNYSLTVMDLDGCVAVDNITITQPAVLTGSAVGETVACNGDPTGDINLSVTGGTMPYTYNWDNGAGTNEDPSGLNAGVYSVTITDANLCTVTASAQILEPSSLTASATGEALLCNGDTDGNIDLTVTGGTIPYTYSWNNGVPPVQDPSGLGANIYFVTVTDANMCMITASAEVSVPAALSASATGEALLCSGDSDGDIDLTVSGGTIPYTFSWNNGAGTNEDPSGLQDGTYSVTITDANNCTITASAQITEPTSLSASTTGETLLCNGDTDGNIDLTVSGGTLPYTFVWDNGAGTDEDPSGLAAGTYTVTVTDQNACTITSSAQITQPSLLSSSIDATSDANCTSCDGTADLNVTNGTPPYTYLWDNGNTTEDPVDLCSGGNGVTVTDANGCAVTALALIGNTSSLVIDNATTDSDVSCNGFSDGQASVSASGGQTPYTFMWSNGATDATASNLIAGSYTITVMDSDGCVSVDIVSITEPSALGLTMNLINDVSCNSANDGSAEAQVTGGTLPYTYSWDNGEFNPIATSLNGGTHLVTVSDGNGCTITGSISVFEPSALIALGNVLNNVNCNGDSDGSAEMNTSGGLMPYTFSWDNGETDAIATALPAGNHTGTVTDANSCTSTVSVFISEPPLFVTTIDGTTDANCSSCDGTASLTVSGGVPPYTYTWTNGNTTEDPIDLCAGNQTVTISDGNGCTSVLMTVVGSISTLAIDNITVDSHVSCSGGSDGQATAIISGGQSAYTFTWSGGQTDATATGLTAGSHNITVTDADGCVAVNSVVINEPSSLSLLGNVISNVNCNGDSDGSGEVLPIGGTNPFTYAWDNGETDAVATMLNAGTHVVTVTDANNCSQTTSLIISQNAALSASGSVIDDVTCTGGSDGNAQISASGGTLPHTYSWDNGESTSTATLLNAGTHSATVTDNNGCTATISVDITEPALLTGSVLSNTPANCTACDGTADLEASGGVPPYTYSWSNGNTNQDPADLCTGLAQVTITDANGCTATTSSNIGNISTLSIDNITADNQVSCNGGNDGQATVTVSGGELPYTYQWSNGVTDATASNLPANNYSVTVSDPDGCIEISSIVISEPAAISLSLNVLSDVSCSGQTDGSAEAIVSGGTPAYTYAWDNGETDAIATSLAGGPHNITITDSNGCTSTSSVNIGEPASITTVPNVISNVSCNGDSDGSASVTTIGGTLPYTYLWDNGETTQTSVMLNAGPHSVSITDANACTASASVMIFEPSAINITVDGNTPANCSSCDGTASITIAGGNPPYAFNWSNGNTNEDPVDLCTGANDFTITDSNGCIATGTTLIGNISTIVVDNVSVLNNVSCNGGSDGQGSISVSGGQLPYTYAWSNGASSSFASGLIAGNYTVTVTDTDGCFGTGAISITEPSALSITASVVSDVSCNGGNDGSASASVSGGTVPYTYSWDNGETSSVAVSLNSGNHTVTITDNNNCTTTGTVNLTEPSALSISVDGTTTANCTSCDGTASISVGGGTTPYIFNWSNGNTNEDPANLCSGGNSVTVTDAQGCTITANAVVGNTSTLVISSITADNHVSCNGANDGQATVSPSGGQPPYTYNWSTSGTTSTINGLSGGTYTVTVTDMDGCLAVDNVNINEPAALSIIPNLISNVSCNGGSDGSAQVLPIGGTTAYTYNWDNGETTPVATALNAGTHVATVTDANGCTATSSVNISQPAPLIASAIVNNDISCNGANNGSATGGGSGGSMPYTFSWSNGETGTTATALSPGNQIVTVTDSNSCTATAQVNILEPAVLGLLVAIANNVSCTGGSDGSATATPSGGTPAYTFEWDNGETNSTAINLNNGNHTITVTDANGCTQTANVSISEPAQLALSVDSSSPANCASCDGTADITASGGSGPYTYSWSNGNSSEDPLDLCSGINTVTVTDNNGCMATASTNIGNNSTLVISTLVLDNGVSCNGFSNGQATVTAAGGQTPYTFTWSGGQTIATAMGLAGGLATVTVTDADGCVAVDNIMIPEPAVLSPLASEDQAVGCFGDTDGQATVSTTGGTVPYTFMWDSGSTSLTATNLSAGNHIVTVTDANGCTETSSVNIGGPATGVAISLDSQTPSNCTSCDGTASITVSGGNPPYTYSWDNGNTSEDPVDLCTGFNTLTVSDASGCTGTISVNVGNTSTLLVNSVVQDSPVTCNGGSDGVATATASGGQVPYTFIWSNGATSATASGLPSGMATVTVSDFDGCTAAGSVLISQPSPINPAASLLMNVSCSGGNDGSASVSGSGGITPYTYLWDNGETTSTATALIAGTHLVTVSDSNGCSETTSIIITQPAALTASAVEDQGALCNGDANGQSTLTVSGGTMPYTYTWDNGESTLTATGLIAGTHIAVINDANGCATAAGVIITEPAALSPVASVDQNVSCNGNSDGQASVSTSGGTMPYTFIWDSGEATSTATQLNAGTHLVTVTDANGCIQTASVDITEPGVLSPLANQDQAVQCNGNSDGQASVSTSGGTMPYTFNWDSGETLSSATMLNAGTHLVTVTDANGCAETASVLITEPTALIALAAEDQGVLCFGDANGQATVTAAGGTTTYTYAWDSGSTNASASNLTGGPHTVTVTDANGCIQTASVTISEPALLTATAAQDAAVTCNGGADGQATVSPSGGTTPYTYAWDSGETSASASMLNAGSHLVTVTDANGCAQTATVDITEPGPLGITITTDQDVQCNGGSDGQATAAVSGGTMPFTFAWDNGETTASASMLNAGNHLVVVTDANGCMDTGSVVITEPGVLSPLASQDQAVQCNGGSDGQASVSTNGGTTPYTFAWDSGETTASATQLNAGTHVVTVTDANGCFETTSVIIIEPAVLSPVAGQDQAVQCNGGSDGQASVSTSGGTLPYNFAWDSGETTATATALNAGNHLVTVTDANGCAETASVIITEPPVLGLTISSTPVTCFGAIDGQGMATVSGGTPAYTYNWDNGEVSNPAFFLTAGNHVLTVTDQNGCTITGSVTVGSPAPLIPSGISSTPTNCFGGNDGTATAGSTGGTPPYTFNWSNGQSGSVATGLTAGVYQVVISDANGCSLPPISVTVGQPAQSIMASVTGTDPLCFGGDDGSLTATATGGTPSYQFTWSNGAVGPTAFGLEAGSYSLTVTDANGCEAIQSFSLDQPEQVSALVSANGTICFDDANGSIAVDTAFGGVGPYIYSLDGQNYQASALFAGLEGGLYEVWVQDINGCESAQDILVEEPFEIVVDLGADVEVVLGDSIRLVADVNTTDTLSYLWSPPQYLSCITCESPVVRPLETTQYTLMVVDTNGCSAVDQILVTVDKSRDVFIPNAFSPNGDGTNDLFMIFSNQGVAQVRMFRVFDRWGEQVFQGQSFQPNDPSFGWDGRMKGKELNPAVFVYFAEIEFVDGATIMYKGDVTLLK